MTLAVNNVRRKIMELSMLVDDRMADVKLLNVASQHQKVHHREYR